MSSMTTDFVNLVIDIMVAMVICRFTVVVYVGYHGNVLSDMVILTYIHTYGQTDRQTDTGQTD